MKKQLSRVLAMALAVVLIFGMMPLSALATESAPTYTVSGNVPGNGSITATNANGEETVFENALVNGSYSISLADGVYSLYFDCGSYEGMIPQVTVSGADVTANLEKTYQKLTPHKEGSAGTANWVLTDNGKYAVQTSNNGGDTISMGTIATIATLDNTDFVMNTHVEAAGSKAVMIGLVLNGTNAAGKREVTVFGLNNSNQTAQIRALLTNGWPGYRNLPNAYDRTGFDLKIMKEGNQVSYYINGVYACTWYADEYSIAGWTNVSVGLGFYRMHDVTFSDYSYSRINTVSGTVAGNVSGNVTAIDANGNEQVFKNALKDGSYSIKLTDGRYDLHFDCGTAEGLLKNVVVSNANVTADLSKIYQKLTSYKEGVNGTANWVLADNGRYEVKTSNTSDDAISMGWFVENANMSATNFVIRTHVEAGGNKAVLLGLAMSGKNAAGANETAVFGLANNGNFAQIRALKSNGWPGYKALLTNYDHTSFDLIIVKNGDNISYYIDSIKACEWYAADYDFTGWTETKIGLGFYRMYDVTFSDYSYSANAEDVAAAKGLNVTYGTLPEGVTVSVKNNAVIQPETVISVNGLTNENLVYTVRVNGQQVVQSNGAAQITVNENVNIEVTVAQKITSFAVSGTAPGNGTVTATDENGEEVICLLANGNYSMLLPNGTYKLYFDCDNYEGLINNVIVNGAEVTANLDKLYQKLTPHKEGVNGTATWVLADNGRYEVKTSNTSDDAISMGSLATIAELDDVNFEINTHVEAAGSKAVMIGLVLNGTNAAGKREVTVFGLNNSNQTAQIRALLTNGWPGYRNLPNAYDRTGFDLKIMKEGNQVSYYINGVYACTWYADEYSIAGWTNVSVGLGFYRMYDVTFSDYSYTASYAVSGTVADNANGDVTATDANGNEQIFEDALKNGKYKIILPNGTYKLYFDCGNYEGMITNVVVNDGTVTADLNKTYQKVIPYQIGVDGFADWKLTDNGRYEVKTSNTNVDAISMGHFASSVNLDTTDFVIETNVEAAGSNAVLLGLVISKSNETVVYGLNNSNQSAQIRVMQANGWPGYKNVPSYDRTNFALKIVKSGTTVTYFINGVQACQWTAADYNFSGWTEATVGLGFYRMYDVTFSDYTYIEVDAAVNKWNLVLDDDLKVNYYLNIDKYTAATATVDVAVGGETVSYNAAEMEKVDGLYVASIHVAAAQMTDTITVSVVNNGKTLFSNTYTIREYCDEILSDANYVSYHALINEMLAYGGAAQTYFDYNNANLEDLASYGITGTGTTAIPEAAEPEMAISGEAEGINFYGASLVFRDKIAVRFYFTGSSEGIEGAVDKGDMFYIEVADILPQNLDEAVTVTVNGLTVSYSPMNYIVRMNEKGSDNLQALLKALYNYHLAAKALRA